MTVYIHLVIVHIRGTRKVLLGILCSGKLRFNVVTFFCHYHIFAD